MAKYASNLIVGQIGESDVNTSKQIRDVTPELFSVYPDNNDTPMLALTSSIRHSRKATNIKHEWMNKDYFPRWDTVSAITSGNGTATIVLTPTNINYYRIGDVVEFFNGTGGQTTYGVVEAKSTTITVDSLDGTSTLPTLAADNAIHNLGTAAEEIGSAPTPKNVKSDFLFNYPIFMRYPTEIGILELGTSQYSGPEKSERQKEQELEIKISAEAMMHFGERGKQDGVGGQTQVFMRGVKRWTELGDADNILSWGGSLTESSFREWLAEGPCKYGSREKFFPMSTSLFMQMDSWAGTKQNIEVAGGVIDVMGIHLIKYMSPTGKILNLHIHHMYEEQYDGWGQIIDLAGNLLLPYANNPIFGFKDNTQENDASSEEFEWQFLATMETRRSEWNGLVKAS